MASVQMYDSIRNFLCPHIYLSLCLKNDIFVTEGDLLSFLSHVQIIMTYIKDVLMAGLRRSVFIGVGQIAEVPRSGELIPRKADQISALQGLCLNDSHLC